MIACFVERAWITVGLIEEFEADIVAIPDDLSDRQNLVFGIEPKE